MGVVGPGCCNFSVLAAWRVKYGSENRDTLLGQTNSDAESGATMATNVRILVVEDERIVAKDMQTMLQRLGYDVPAIAVSGEEAIIKAAQTQPDLVLMDIIINGTMDGIEAANQIRSQFDVPVIYVTAYADEALLQRAKMTEPFGYIIKPFSERELHTNIEMALYKHKMEIQLKESEKWLATTLESIGDALIATDSKGMVTFMNPVAEGLTGWKRKEALGKDVNEVFKTMNEENRSSAENPVEKVLREGLIIGLADHTVLLSRDGREIPIDDSGAPITNDKEETIGVVLVFRDISERRRAEDEKEKMQAQFLQAQKMEAVGRLASGVAHDFNNVLTTINGYSEMLMRCLEQGDPMVKNLEQIHRAGQRAASLTHQLLAFSRRQVVQPKVLDLGAVVADMDKMLRRVIGEDVELVMVLTPGLAHIKADLGQMEQVIMNLVVNARDAMPQGGKLTIKTGNMTLNEKENKLFPEARPGTFVWLSVEDTGTGIDKAIIDRVFEPFFTTKGPAQGTGLGLSTVYGIVRQHGGWIDVCSEPGQGATFKVYLPATAAKREDETEESISLHELKGSGERILLVEDEREVREVIAKLLGENGYIVFEAGSSEEALDIFEREMGDFHLVFSDVVLPGKDGLQLVEQLMLGKPELRVLLTSGYSDDRSRWLDVQERGFRFVQKPLTSAGLLRATRQAIEPS